MAQSADDAGGGPSYRRCTMLLTVTCSCGALLEGTSGESLLTAVEGHAAEAHAETAWRWGPSLGDLRGQVALLGRRVETIERSLGTACDA